MNVEDIADREGRLFYIIGYLDARGFLNDDINGLERIYNIMASYGKKYANRTEEILNNKDMSEDEKIYAIRTLFLNIKVEGLNKLSNDLYNFNR